MFFQPSVLLIGVSVLGPALGWSSATYVQPDQLSIRMLTDSNGNVIGQRGHYPYGESWYNNAGSSEWVFSTYQRDTESANDYGLARECVNRLGRFEQLDPLAGESSDPQSLALYSYVIDDPINLIDPAGTNQMCAPSAEAGIAAGRVQAAVQKGTVG